MSRKLLLLLLPLVLTALVSCGSSSNKASAIRHFEVFDINGKSHNSEEWIGKQPVVLNFWGTWCGPCRKEMPDLVRLYKEYAPRGIEMLGFAVNDRPDRVERFSRQYGMQWAMLLASRDVVMRFGVVSAIPQTIFLDKNGREIKRFVGARSYQTLKTGFEALLNE